MRVCPSDPRDSEGRSGPPFPSVALVAMSRSAEPDGLRNIDATLLREDYVPSVTGRQNPKLDTGYHDRRLARRLEDPEFQAEFERQRAEIAAIDAVVNELDALRERSGMTKAALARAIDKNPAAVRRLLTASGNPELRTVVAIAQALGAEVRIVPKTRARGASGARRRGARTAA